MTERDGIWMFITMRQGVFFLYNTINTTLLDGWVGWVVGYGVLTVCGGWMKLINYCLDLV